MIAMKWFHVSMANDYQNDIAIGLGYYASFYRGLRTISRAVVFTKVVLIFIHLVV